MTMKRALKRGFGALTCFIVREKRKCRTIDPMGTCEISMTVQVPRLSWSTTSFALAEIKSVCLYLGSRGPRKSVK